MVQLLFTKRSLARKTYKNSRLQTIAQAKSCPQLTLKDFILKLLPWNETAVLFRRTHNQNRLIRSINCRQNLEQHYIENCNSFIYYLQ